MNTICLLLEPITPPSPPFPKNQTPDPAPFASHPNHRSATRIAHIASTQRRARRHCRCAAAARCRQSPSCVGESASAFARGNRYQPRNAERDRPSQTLLWFPGAFTSTAQAGSASSALVSRVETPPEAWKHSYKNPAPEGPLPFQLSGLLTTDVLCCVRRFCLIGSTKYRYPGELGPRPRGTPSALRPRYRPSLPPQPRDCACNGRRVPISRVPRRALSRAVDAFSLGRLFHLASRSTFCPSAILHSGLRLVPPSTLKTLDAAAAASVIRPALPRPVPSDSSRLSLALVLPLPPSVLRYPRP